jgi:hypothetical protein
MGEQFAAGERPASVLKTELFEHALYEYKFYTKYIKITISAI